MRWNWRAAMPRWMNCRALVLELTSADDELVLLDDHVELIEGEAGDGERDAQTLGVALVARKALDIVGGIAVRRFG